MAYTCMSPFWFNGYDVGLEIVFAVISLVIAIFAVRLYWKTDQRQIKFFSLAFLFIGLSYLIESVFNYLIITRTAESVCRAVSIESVEIFNALGAYAHMFFKIIGFVILVYLTIRTENRRVLWLLLITSLLVIFLSINPIFVFYLLSSIYLIFITWYYADNYQKNRQLRSLLVVVAFLFLLFSSVHFLIAENYEMFYVIAYVLEFLAYTFILANLYLVLKK